MSRLLLSAAVAALFAVSAPAFAQHDHDGHGGPGGGPGGPGGGAPHMAHAAPGNAPRPQMDHRPSAGQQAAPAARPATIAPPARPALTNNRMGGGPANPPPNNGRMGGPNTNGRMGGPNTNGRMGGPNTNGRMGGPNTNGRMGNPSFNRPGNPPAAHPGPNRPGGNGGHPDYSRYHRNAQASHRFHAPSYRRPSGWYSHRWTYGEILPALFWAPNYWLNDYNDYDLPLPPPGTVWVRDGDDALLIDRVTGEIVEVEYGVFY